MKLTGILKQFYELSILVMLVQTRTLNWLVASTTVGAVSPIEGSVNKLVMAMCTKTSITIGWLVVYTISAGRLFQLVHNVKVALESNSIKVKNASIVHRFDYLVGKRAAKRASHVLDQTGSRLTTRAGVERVVEAADWLLVMVEPVALTKLSGSVAVALRTGTGETVDIVGWLRCLMVDRSLLNRRNDELTIVGRVGATASGCGVGVEVL